MGIGADGMGKGGEHGREGAFFTGGPSHPEASGLGV